MSGAWLLVAFVVAQSVPRLSGDAVLDRVVRQFEGIVDYTVDVEVNVAMEGLKIPRAQVKMYVKRPDKVHFDSPSFAMLPREGLTIDPAELRRMYDVQSLGMVDTMGGVWYKLQLAAKSPETRLRQMYLWVEKDAWTIRRIESSPYSGRIVAVDFTHEKVDERYTLFSKAVATFGTVGPQTEPLFKLPEGAPNPAPQFQELQRSLRSGSVTFRYTNYRINTNLPDSLFVTPSR
jgi:outer membrane lipoprotein-sorting protein